MLNARGDMWQALDEADLFCITTCNSIRNDGRLVMGAGIAKQAVHRFPGIDLEAANILRVVYPSINPVYGLLQIPGKKIALFQTKGSWFSDSSLKLILRSTNDLSDWARNNPEKKAHLNYPGIGCGKLSRKTVSEVIEILPDNVTVWRL